MSWTDIWDQVLSVYQALNLVSRLPWLRLDADLAVLSLWVQAHAHTSQTIAYYSQWCWQFTGEATSDIQPSWMWLLANAFSSGSDLIINNSSTSLLAMLTEKYPKNQTHKYLYFAVCLSWLHHFPSGRNKIVVWNLAICLTLFYRFSRSFFSPTNCSLCLNF